MENTIQPDHELEKGEEINESVPPTQQNEVEASGPRVDPGKIQDELTEAKDKYLRLYAEFENHRRRTAKERIELIQTANEQLIKTLLPVLDDFERAEKAFKDKTDKESEGFFLIQNKFRKTLEGFGVKPMEVGLDFNPDLHDAITQIPASDETLKGKIIDVVERGYLLYDKVIRHAKVVIGQ
jgi:molecular chaperone GrpE